MNCRTNIPSDTKWIILLMLLVTTALSCNTTKHLKEGEHLLRSNSLKLKSDRSITRRGELNEQLQSLIIQKPNSYALGFIPFKLWLYNTRYKKYSNDTANFQIKSRTVEKPVIYDSLLRRKSAQNLRSFLFNQGYFYAKVMDTVKFRGKKAYVSYNVQTGPNYLINKTYYDIDDSTIQSFVADAASETVLKKGQEFTYSMLEEERSRITNVLRNNGYYFFSQDNISFQLDTLNKSYLKNIENPFESAINFVALQKQKKRPTLDIKVTIRADGDTNAYKRYQVGRVTVFTDFDDLRGARDSMLHSDTVGNINFRYYRHYVKEQVLLRHIYFVPGELFSQENYDLTITKLNELSIFQSIRLFPIVDTSRHDANVLRFVILLYPTKKYDFTTNFEVSNGSTYSLGGAVSVGLRNRNLGKGANQFSVTLSGGLESVYYPKVGNTFFDHFYLLSKNLGVNTTLNMPKFLAPVRRSLMDKSNLPRTIISFGYNLLDRVDYFTLTSTSANLTYNWKQNKTNTWDFSPAFINILRLPRIADSFSRRLAQNDFLRNSYKENFIEGENISFTYSDQGLRKSRYDYTYLKLSVEEAGGVLSGINSGIKVFNPDYDLKNYAQYVKFDLDARHYFYVKKAMLAVRLYGGIGVPYDKSSTLPYVKQYFVGGAYSIRGWRVRSLGPGATPPSDSVNYIDRTGDLKLEANAEYRFPVVQLFSGSLKLNGAVFTDAGNIWLAESSAEYPNGTLSWSRFGHDIAVSSGAGLRIDVGGFFTIRGDVAFPIKKPYIADFGGWVLRDVNFGSRTWRQDNLVLNIAIGYPF
jgi:outer membrane protein assembly factor BamA